MHACPMINPGRLGAEPLTVCSKAVIAVGVIAVAVPLPDDMIHSALAIPTKRSVCAAIQRIGPLPGAFRSKASP